MVQEILEITVDTGAAKERLADPEEGRYEKEGDEDGEVGRSMRWDDTGGRRCETGIRSGRQDPS